MIERRIGKSTHPQEVIDAQYGNWFAHCVL